jgi:hypothetical protein
MWRQAISQIESISDTCADVTKIKQHDAQNLYTGRSSRRSGIISRSNGEGAMPIIISDVGSS